VSFHKEAVPIRGCLFCFTLVTVSHLIEGNEGKKDWDWQEVFVSFGSVGKPCGGVSIAIDSAVIPSGVEKESHVTAQG